RRAPGAPFSAPGLTGYLAGIASAYSLDRLLDRSAEYPRWFRNGLVGVFAVSTPLGLAAAVWLPAEKLRAALGFAAASLFYRRLKRYPMVKTAVGAAVWTWAAAALPIERAEWAAWDWWSIDASWPLFLLLSAGCILCDFKDVERDRETGVGSLPV